MADQRSIRDIALETYESMRPEGQSPRGKVEGPDTVKPAPERKPAAPAKKKASPKKTEAKPQGAPNLGTSEPAAPNLGESEQEPTPPGPGLIERAADATGYLTGAKAREFYSERVGPHLGRMRDQALNDLANRETVRDSAARHWTEAEQLEHIYAAVPPVAEVRGLLRELEEASVGERPQLEQKLRDIQSNAQLARKKYVDLNVQNVDDGAYEQRRRDDIAFDRRFGMEPNLETLSDDRLNRMKERDVVGGFGRSSDIPDRMLDPEGNAERVLHMIQRALKTEDQPPGRRERDWGTEGAETGARPKEKQQ